MMRHDETRARREARAEAFEEAGRICGDRGYHEFAIIFRRLMDEERATHAPKPPVRYTEAPERSRASSWPPNARDGITDCVEDGWTTEHVTGWPDSYPFEALDPWPEDADVDGGRGGA
jgi:hypothetical protein